MYFVEHRFDEKVAGIVEDISEIPDLPHFAGEES
jgi:hypothetical protein